MIRVLIVDDHAVVRAGLEQLLAARRRHRASSARPADGEEAVALALERAARRRADGPLDAAARRHRGHARAITAPSARRRVVVLTSFSDRERILDALDAGAVGYLLKDAEPDELLRGIRAAAARRVAARAQGRAAPC